MLSVFTACLSCLGYDNKIPATGKLLNNRNLFLAVLETESWGSGWQRGRFWWCPSSRRQMAVLSLCPRVVQGGQGALCASLIRALNLLMRVPLLWPKYLLRAPPPNIIILGSRISAYEFGSGEGRHKCSDCNTTNCHNKEEERTLWEMMDMSSLASWSVFCVSYSFLELFWHARFLW